MDFQKDERWHARNAELLTATRSERTVELEGLTLRVDRDVFPPDLGLASRALVQAVAAERVPSALDVGTGTLLIALALRRAGVGDVWATDLHPPAVACARHNLSLNAALGPITIVEGDLLAAIPADKRFHLIVFNQPFYPIADAPIAGMGADGGAAITRRFLTEARHHLAPGGAVMMPYYAPMAGTEHNPALIARRLEWAVEAARVYGDDRAGVIYKMWPPTAPG